MYEYHEITILLIFNQIFKSYIQDTRLKSYCIVDDTAIMSNYIFSKFEILHIFFNYTYMSCQFLDFWTKIAPTFFLQAIILRRWIKIN